MSDERKLVTVRTIAELNPIPGADQIVVASIDGWRVVCGKDDFKVGDRCFYFEIDSFIPEALFEYMPWMERLASHYQGKRGARVKTIKLRGQLSQGLAVPLATFNKIIMLNDVCFTGSKEPFPADYAHLLGVVKYDGITEEHQSGASLGRTAGAFPSFIRKTDEERIQNVWNALKYEKWGYSNNHTYEITEKLDGSSMTVYFYQGKFGVCSRNLEVKRMEIPLPLTWFQRLVNWFFPGSYYLPSIVPSALWDIVDKYDLEKKIWASDKFNGLRDAFAIQGELVGPGMNRNRLELTEKDFYVFNIFDIKKQEYVDSFTCQEICEWLGLKHVPLLHGTGMGFPYETVEEAIKSAEGMSVLNKGKMREGVVYKSIENPSLSFKIINNRYLLKHDE